MKERPRIVCLCGSTRFFKEYYQANSELTLAGNIVLSVGCFRHQLTWQSLYIDGCMGMSEVRGLLVQDVGQSHWTEEQKRLMDELHLRKIDLADEVLVISPAPGCYIGDSTRREIEYAMQQEKPVKYWRG